MTESPELSASPLTYQICFRDHDIPNVAVSAVSGDKVFYYHEKAVNSYSLAGEHRKLFAVNSSTHLAVVGGTALCSVSGNVLTIFDLRASSGKQDMKLRGIPLQITMFSDRNTHYMGFLHQEMIEIVKFRDGAKRTLIGIDLPFRARSMATTEDSTFILTEDGEIFRCRNVFVTQCLTFGSRLVGACGDFIKIYSHGSEIYLKSKMSVSKYETSGDALILQYSIGIRSPEDEIVQGFILSDTLIQLGKAPFVIVRDRVFCMDGNVAVTAGRVYFINREAAEEEAYRPTYEMKNYASTIHPGTVVVPEFIKHEGQRDQYFKNAMLLKKYEAVLKAAQSINTDLEIRELKDDDEFKALTDEITQLEERRGELAERVAKIKAKAGRVRISGDLTVFYEKMRELEKLLDAHPRARLDEYKEKLRAQRAVLRERLI